MSILDTLAFWRRPSLPLPMAREEVARAVPTPAEFIAQWEGFRAAPYLDTGGVATIGYGCTRYPDGRAVAMADPACTRQQATEWLAHHIRDAEEAVRLYVLAPLTEGQRVALVSFVYNCGAAAFSRSTLLRLLNKGDTAGAAEEFDKWVLAKGRRLPGLVKRRAAEAALFRGGA